MSQKTELDQSARMTFRLGDPLLTTKDIAGKLNCHPKTICRYSLRGWMPAPLRPGHWESLAVAHWLICLQAGRADPVAFPLLASKPDAVLFNGAVNGSR